VDEGHRPAAAAKIPRKSLRFGSGHIRGSLLRISLVFHAFSVLEYSPVTQPYRLTTK